MNIHKYIFIIIGISLFSCQQTDELSDETGTVQSEIRLRADGNNNAAYNLIEEDPILENNMEWVSYLIAETLLFSPESRTYVANLISNNPNFNGIIPLNVLLDQNENNEAFLIAFEEHFWCFENQGANCGTNGGRPQGRVNPGDNAPPTCINAYCEFLNYVLSINCIELFLPHGINFSTAKLQIASTAHPLNNDLFNDVYIHNSVLVQAGIISNNGIIMSDPSLEDTQYELDEVANIIVARPYRNTTNCTYTRFANDFTLFLGY